MTAVFVVPVTVAVNCADVPRVTVFGPLSWTVAETGAFDPEPHPARAPSTKTEIKGITKNFLKFELISLQSV
jgi:hypothetical protein